MVEPQGGLQLLDTRALGKPSAFSGQEQDWLRWCFALASYARLLSTILQLVMLLRLQLSLDVFPRTVLWQLTFLGCTLQSWSCRQHPDER